MCYSIVLRSLFSGYNTSYVLVPTLVDSIIVTSFFFLSDFTNTFFGSGFRKSWILDVEDGFEWKFLNCCPSAPRFIFILCSLWYLFFFHLIFIFNHNLETFSFLFILVVFYTISFQTAFILLLALNYHVSSLSFLRVLGLLLLSAACCFTLTSSATQSTSYWFWDLFRYWLD